MVGNARQVVFRALDGLPDVKRSTYAKRACEALQAAGFFAGSIEQHYSAVRVAELLGRSPAFVAKLAAAGKLGRVFRDGAGWFIPWSGVQAWLESKTFSTSEVAA